MQVPPTIEVPIETGRLALEPLVPAHASRVYHHLQEVALYTYIPQEPPGSVEEVEERYRRLATRRSPDGRELWPNWAARLRSGGAYVGLFEATVRPDAPALIAYTVFGPYQGRGYAGEGCRRMLAFLANDCGVRRVAAEIDTRNAASIALVESLGFARVGMRRDADFFKGSSSDEYRYERELAASA